MDFKISRKMSSIVNFFKKKQHHQQNNNNNNNTDHQREYEDNNANALGQCSQPSSAAFARGKLRTASFRLPLYRKQSPPVLLEYQLTDLNNGAVQMPCKSPYDVLTEPKKKRAIRSCPGGGKEWEKPKQLRQRQKFSQPPTNGPILECSGSYENFPNFDENDKQVLALNNNECGENGTNTADGGAKDCNLYGQQNEAMEFEQQQRPQFQLRHKQRTGRSGSNNAASGDGQQECRNLRYHLRHGTARTILQQQQKMSTSEYGSGGSTEPSPLNEPQKPLLAATPDLRYGGRRANDVVVAAAESRSRSHRPQQNVGALMPPLNCRNISDDEDDDDDDENSSEEEESRISESFIQFWQQQMRVLKREARTYRDAAEKYRYKYARLKNRVEELSMEVAREHDRNIALFNQLLIANEKIVQLAAAHQFQQQQQQQHNIGGGHTNNNNSSLPRVLGPQRQQQQMLMPTPMAAFNNGVYNKAQLELHQLQSSAFVPPPEQQQQLDNNNYKLMRQQPQPPQTTLVFKYNKEEDGSNNNNNNQQKSSNNNSNDAETATPFAPLQQHGAGEAQCSLNEIHDVSSEQAEEEPTDDLAKGAANIMPTKQLAFFNNNNKNKTIRSPTVFLDFDNLSLEQARGANDDDGDNDVSRHHFSSPQKLFDDAMATKIHCDLPANNGILGENLVLQVEEFYGQQGEAEDLLNASLNSTSTEDSCTIVPYRPLHSSIIVDLDKECAVAGRKDARKIRFRRRSFSSNDLASIPCSQQDNDDDDCDKSSLRSRYHRRRRGQFFPASSSDDDMLKLWTKQLIKRGDRILFKPPRKSLLFRTTTVGTSGGTADDAVKPVERIFRRFGKPEREALSRFDYLRDEKSDVSGLVSSPERA